MNELIFASRTHPNFEVRAYSVGPAASSYANSQWVLSSRGVRTFVGVQGWSVRFRGELVGVPSREREFIEAWTPNGWHRVCPGTTDMGGACKPRVAVALSLADAIALLFSVPEIYCMQVKTDGTEREG